MKRYRVTFAGATFEVGVEPIEDGGDGNGNGGGRPFPGGEWRVVKQAFNVQENVGSEDKVVLEPLGDVDNRIAIPAGDHVLVSPGNTVTGRGHARNLYAWSEGRINFWDREMDTWVLTEDIGKPETP